VLRRMPAYLPYRLLALATGTFCLISGLLFVVAFLDRALFPVLARPLFDTDFWGAYVLGFAGSALVAWGACLFSVVRNPTATSGIATATAIGLIVGSILRLLAWYSGEYRFVGDQLRIESALMTLCALGFVWLRPTPNGPRAS